MGQVITFYSYKGGVGRTMALANIAVLLAKWDYNVLVIDWDLEAPGIEYFFKDFASIHNITNSAGLIDLLFAFINKPQESSVPLTWEDFVLPIEIPGISKSIDLITAGRRDKDYFNKVRNLDVQDFYAEHEGGFFIEDLRKAWKHSYDFVLIDSRTGITDIGGICTIQMPDILILLFTATNQSLEGILEVAEKAVNAQEKLPVDRYTLLCLPIPTRFDASEEFETSREWLNLFDKELEPIYQYWLPVGINPKDFLEIIKVPYIAYFSFGEKLPVLEQGVTDPQGIGYAYETISALIAKKLAGIAQLVSDRSSFTRSAKIKETGNIGSAIVPDYSVTLGQRAEEDEECVEITPIVRKNVVKQLRKQKLLCRALAEEMSLSDKPDKIADELCNPNELEWALINLHNAVQTCLKDLSDDQQNSKRLHQMRESALEMLSWLLLLSVKHKWVVQNIGNQSTYIDLSPHLQTKLGVEITLARLDQRPAILEINPAKRKIAGKDSIDSDNLLEMGWTGEDIIKGVKRELWKKIYPERGDKTVFTKTDDEQLKYKIELCRKMRKADYYVTTADSANPLRDQKIYRVLTDSLGLRLVLYGIASSEEILIELEYKLEELVNEFLETLHEYA